MAKYGSEGISASRNGSAWVEPVVTSFFFMFSVAGRHGSVRANQELDAGPQGSEQSHSRISNRVHTELKPYRPVCTRVDPHCKQCQFLMDSGSRYNTAVENLCLCSKF